MRTSRRGGTLVVALAVVVLGAAVAVAMIAAASAALDVADASWERQRLRSAALSGLGLATAELALQRPELLRGEDPRLSDSVVVFTESGRRGVARLVPVGGLTATPESARLDLNRATPEMLAGLPGLDAQLAAAVVEARAAGFESPEALTSVPGLDPAALYARGADEPATAPRLLDLVTVFGFDADQTSQGRPRVRPEEEPEALPEGVRSIVQRLGGHESGFAGVPELVGALLAAGVPASEWPAVLDAVSVGGELFPPGRVDLNRAPAEVLAVLPGLDRESADALVAARDGLSAERRATIAWPVLEGVLAPERFRALSGWVTPRTLVWRVRVEATIEPEPGLETAPSGEPPPSMTIEAVIDLTEARPRIAYLREVGWLDAAVELAGRIPAPAETVGPAPLGASADDPTGERFAALELDGLGQDERPGRGFGLDLGVQRPTRTSRSGGEDRPPARKDGRIGRWRAGPDADEGQRSGTP